MNGLSQISFEKQLMQRCITLARLGRGKTSPNPLVGAIALQDGQIIGEGFHPAVGEPHAEIFALQAAGEKAQGSTIYVNLEPCNHYGRTPPCTEALIEAGVKKVVVGMIDPNPRVSGKGIEKLRNAGIEVVVGLEEEACRQLNEAFIHRVNYQLPLGILKYAMTLDGKIATTTGHSAWVTGKSARGYVHQLRAGCDAIIIGGNTLRRDDPHLTTHGVAAHTPLRVVMSRSLDLPLNCYLWETKTAPTVVFTQKGNNQQLKSELLSKGVEVVELAALNPPAVLKNLYHRGLSSVLWECGGVLAAQAIATGCVQKVFAFIAPKIIGGVSAPSPVGALGLEKMTEALELEKVKISQFDRDWLIEGYMKNKF